MTQETATTTKVLFVDDELNVLSGLRRMLRGQRSCWDMQFANSAAEALELLQVSPVDAIVTDMRMPGMDGTALLAKVAELYPNTVRLVLSGQSEQENIMRAVGNAHQFLSKPCDPKVLINTVKRACGLRSQLQDESLKNLTSQLKLLPSLPNVYHELVQALNSEDTSIQQIGDKIGSDLAMTAKVLQLVNSSFFGLPQHVTCPRHAVSLLGVNVIRPLVLSASAFAKYDDPNIDGFSLEEVIEHSLAVATTARQIAEQETNDNQLIDDSFIAGLMHDVGKLILAVNLPQRYATAIARTAAEDISLCDAEFDEFSSTHAEVGAHLLGLWGLPNPVVEAITFHHRPLDSCATVFSPTTAVYAANLLHQPVDEANPTPLKWDFAHINAIGAMDRLPAWETLRPQQPAA